jgi:hypothetical protein
MATFGFWILRVMHAIKELFTKDRTLSAPASSVGSGTPLPPQRRVALTPPTAPAASGAALSPPSPIPSDGRGVASEASRGEGFDLSASIARHAARIGVDAAVGAAVFEVESGGAMFVDLPGPHYRKPTARFENHVFWERWGRLPGNASAFDRQFRPRSGWRNHDTYNEGAGRWFALHIADFDEAQWRNWEAIRIATALAGEETALNCASFGGPQIMGFNHNRAGYPSATVMVEAFTDPDNQVGALFDFIATDEFLLRAAREHAWIKFAARYNGSGYVDEYSQRIAGAYQKQKTKNQQPGASR